MHQEWHHGLISAQSSTSSPQPLTIKPNDLSQCLLSPVCISLQLTTPSCLWDQSAVLTTLIYLQTFLPPTVFSPEWHTQTDLVWKEEVLKAGLNQMTQWLERSGEARRRVWARRQTVEYEVWGCEECQEGGVKACTQQTPTAASQRGNKSWC